jgi:AraC-like DNA-binding protein
MNFEESTMLIDKGLVPDVEYFVHRKCGADWYMKENILPACDVTYLISGSAQYRINGKPHEVRAGDLLCLPVGTVRAAITYPANLMHCFAVDFKLRNYTGGEAHLPLPVVNHIGQDAALIRLFQELSYTWIDREPVYQVKTLGLTALILNRLLELTLYNNQAVDFRIKKVQRYIAGHYAEAVSVNEMASLVGLNPVYFGALFKRETGLGLRQYAARTRIRNAENMLKSGEYTVEEATGQCGYTDTQYFSELFKTIMGVTPSQCIPK